MSTSRTEEFKRAAVRMALTSGLPRKQLAADLGIGLSTLNKWVKAFGDADTVPQKEAELVKEIERLRRELRIVTEEREVLKNGSGPSPACARYKQLMLRLARRAVADRLLVVLTPLKNVAHGLMRT